LSIVSIPHGQAVASTQKTGILFDLKDLEDRLQKAISGDMKFMQVHPKQAQSALKKLQEAHELLQTGLIPSSKE
jgi:hypothetical protein